MTATATKANTRRRTPANTNMAPPPRIRSKARAQIRLAKNQHRGRRDHGPRGR